MPAALASAMLYCFIQSNAAAPVCSIPANIMPSSTARYTVIYTAALGYRFMQLQHYSHRQTPPYA
eukprot:6342-Heterococcus_DN1.PRE.2